LYNASKEIQDLNIDNLFNKDRNKIQSIVNIGSMVWKGFNILNKTDEIYYGSSTTESTFTAPNDLIKAVQLNCRISLLDKIMNKQ
jgi:hypothetical protein